MPSLEITAIVDADENQRDVLKYQLIRAAVKRDGLDIEPCHNKPWQQSFDEYSGSLYFWYNVISHTTKLLRLPIRN